MDAWPIFKHGMRVRLKTGAATGALVDPGDWATMIRLSDGQEVLVSLDQLVAEWEPEEAAGAERTAVDHAKGAVLHELRSSGPMGLYLSELEQRIGGTHIPEALVELCAEGRVQWPDSLMRAVLTAAQREIDAMRMEIDTLRNSRDVLAEEYADAKRAFEEVREERNAARVSNCGLAGDLGRAQDRIAECEAEITSLYDALLLQAERHNDERYAEAVGANALHAVALAVNTHTTRHAIGAALQRLAVNAVGGAAYTHGLQDAAYVASYGPVGHPRFVVRVILQDGTTIVTLLLGDMRVAGIPLAGHRFVLGSAEHGRIFANEDGTIANSPARIHPGDLAVLQSYGARDQHVKDDATGASGCQQKKSDSVVGEVGCA